MTDSYITNQNISNNIMIPNHNYSLKERRIPHNNNTLIIHSITNRPKPGAKVNKIINDQQTSLRLKQELPKAEEDIDYLKLFSQKNKNAYNNPNNRVRKSKFFYSNRINTSKNQTQIQNPKPIQRAVSSNLNQIQLKNDFNYLKKGSIYLSKSNTNKPEQNFKQSRFNSATERGFGTVKKIVNLKLKVMENKTQRNSGNINVDMNINNNININKKKIPIPQKNGYNINPNTNKIVHPKNEMNDGMEKIKNKNRNFYYDTNIYNAFNNTNGFNQNTNTNLNLSRHLPKTKNVSEMTSLENIIIEDKENIIPNHNNSYNYNTIYGNNTRTTKVSTYMKLYRNNNRNLTNEKSFTNYNQRTKLIPLNKINEQYLYKIDPNYNTKYSNSMKKIENNNYYIINNEASEIKDKNDYFKENRNIIQTKKPKSPKNLREFFIKKVPQYNNNNQEIHNDINIANNTEMDNLQYNYEEKIINNNNQSEYIIKEKNNPKNNNILIQTVDNYNVINNKPKQELIPQITNNVEIYNEDPILNSLIAESINSNIYISQEPKTIQKNHTYENNSSNLLKIPAPQTKKIIQENNKSNIYQLEQNNNIIMMQNNTQNNTNNHFPNPEKPIRKESKSISIPNSNGPNVTYNVFNASGWLKNYAVLTHPGCDKNGKQKTNQDSFVFKTNINGINNFNIFGVMDGHGPQGHFVSQFASKFIPFQITNHREIKNLKDPEKIYQKIKHNEYEIINHIFLETDNQLKKVNFDATESGCTCVLVIHIGSHIICANTGDSRAILVSDSLGENNINDFFEVALSYDYKPEMPEEKQRIESCGGVVEQLKNKLGEGVGPYRVWAKEGGYPGLAMSRSIGDLIGKKLGVIPNPGILEYDLNNNVKYIIAASDGIWEFLTNENVRDVAKKYYMDKNPNGFCHEIVKDAYKIWKENGITVDDITAIAAFF